MMLCVKRVLSSKHLSNSANCQVCNLILFALLVLQDRIFRKTSRSKDASPETFPLKEVKRSVRKIPHRICRSGTMASARSSSKSSLRICHRADNLFDINPDIRVLKPQRQRRCGDAKKIPEVLIFS